MERKFQGDRRIEDGGLCILFWLPSSLKLRRDKTPQNIEAPINANNIIRITKVGIVVKIFLRRGCNCRPVWVRLGRIDFIAQTHSVFTFYLFLISAMKGYSSGIASRCIKPILSRSSVLSTGFRRQSKLQRQGHGCRELIITHVGWGIIVIDIGEQQFECKRIK